MFEYSPNPIDISHVKLNDDTIELMELLAANKHDIWSRQMLAEGWRYGRRLENDSKEHPNLVSYDELPEIEKHKDRNEITNLLKTILAMGYTIDKIQPGLVGPYSLNE